MELAIVVGTRPEIIKMSPVLKACEARDIPYTLIDTRQHFSDNMSTVFYHDLGLKPPDVTLTTDPGSHGVQLASMLPQLEAALQQKPFSSVLVQGDTNSVLAGALMASRLNVPVGHVESGLRSYDRTMPEEANRIMADHLASYLFATSETSAANLVHEGIPNDSIFTVGNTVVDATLRGLAIAKQRAQPDMLVPEGPYVLVTLHRPANVDNVRSLREMLSSIGAVMEHHGLRGIFPVHPRTRQRMEYAGLWLPKHLQLVEPLGYLDFLELLSSAALVMTDSGGIQEEACIVHVPCVTLRDNTERPETITVGANMLGGTKRSRIRQAAETMLARARTWSIPYGDGHTGERIIHIVTEAVTPRSEHTLIAGTARG